VPDVLGSTGNYLKKWKWQHGLPGASSQRAYGFDYMKAAPATPIGSSSACAASTASVPQDREAFYSSRAAPRARLHRHRKLSGADRVQQFRCLCDCGRPSRRPPAGRYGRSRPPGGRRSPAVARCPRRLAKKLARSLQGERVRGPCDFDLRDNIRAEQKKFGMLPDGNPTTALLEKLGVTSAEMMISYPGRPARAVARSAYGLEVHHFQEVAERIETRAARHRGHSRRTCSPRSWLPPCGYRVRQSVRASSFQAGGTVGKTAAEFPRPKIHSPPGLNIPLLVFVKNTSLGCIAG